MATLKIRDIMRWAATSGQPEAEPGSSGYCFQIRFDGPPCPVIDEDFVNRVIVAASAQGVVRITFDDQGLLRSIDFS